MLDYRTAITATEDAIHRRAALFRKLAISVVALVGPTLLYSAVAAEWRGLLVFLLLVPLCGAFFILDGRVVDRWRQQLLAGWTAKDIDVEAFLAAMRAHPRLPRGTLQGMLDTLPASGDLTYEQALQPSTRRAIAAACEADHGKQADALLLRVLAAAVVALAIPAAAWLRSWWPLVGVLALALLPMVGAWLGRRRDAAREATAAACRQQPGFDEAAFAQGRARFG